jgi:hypothetical protein
MKKNIFLICTALMLVSCFGDARLDVINQTSSQITLEHNATEELEPHMLNHTEYSGSWPKFFRASKSKKLYLFVFNFDTLKKYKDTNFLVDRRLIEG